MSFKIIAIKPLKGCDTEYLKVLQEDELYYLYQDYKITEKEIGVEEIEITSCSPNNLYNVKGKKDNVNVNISAIVGKNGSGKSSIIELLFRGINNIASNFKFEELNPEKTILPDIEILPRLKLIFYYQINDLICKIQVNDGSFSARVFETITGKKKKYSLNPKLIEGFSLRNLFYTEVINYSHYAYNSKFEGRWIEKLFHKNDSYQTPVVFNPMRTIGNTDINIEDELVKQRLISNLLKPATKIDEFNFRNIGDNLIADKIILKLKDKKYKVKINDKKDNSFIINSFIDAKQQTSIFFKLYEYFYQVEDFGLLKFKIKPEIYDSILAYAIYKLISITYKYDEYKRYFFRGKKDFNYDKLNEYFKKIKEDESHIAFKLKQTLNYLHFNHIDFNEGEKLQINKISEEVAKIRKNNPSIPQIELMPPPIFDMEILLQGQNTNDIQFERLSSGEKQLIYSVSSILYHLTNLDSVSKNKIQYKNINIVMEEIELYFHPDLQRKFIYHLLKGIENIQLVNIKSINICFVTHSPFILSDIPSKNIMFLKVENGKSIQDLNLKKTFGANIHELLADTFFFEDDIYIGEFVKRQIDNILISFKKYKKDNITNIPNDDLIYYKKFIATLDERILKLKLGEMLAEIINDNQFQNELIDEEIKHLNQRKFLNT